VALKSEFDNKTYLIVLLRALVGAILGSIPGVIYVFASGKTLNTSSFGVSLIQVGACIGAVAMGLAATAATIVATLKSRGSGPQNSKEHKARKMLEYLAPEQLPVIPPPSKPELPEGDKTEIKQAPVHAAPAPEPAMVKAPVVLQSEQSAFEDFDRN
jgi:hypothetical protein